MPYSILFSEASNFATAQQDEWNLWTLALKPEAEMIEDGFNEQLLGPLGLRLEFQFRSSRCSSAARTRRPTKTWRW
jgi:phage portal protein BeeE